MKENSITFLKRYQLLLILVFLLLVIGVGCWLVKKDKSNQTESVKDNILRKLDSK